MYSQWDLHADLFVPSSMDLRGIRERYGMDEGENST